MPSSPNALRRALVLATLATVATASLAAPQAPQASAEEDAQAERRVLLRRTDRQLLAWATERARETLTPLLEAGAADSPVKLLEGRLLEQEGKGDEAARAFQAAADAAPRSVEPHLHLGAWHARAEREENAAAHWKAAWKRAKNGTVRAPEDAAAFTMLGRAALALERQDDAVEAFEKALELSASKDPHALLYLAVIRYRQKRYPAALELLDPLVEAHPYLAHAYFFRGITLSRLDRKADMIADLDRFVAMAPNAPEADSARTLLGAVR